MSVLQDVQDKLDDVLKAVSTLPQGYQYKVRELCSCIETVVSLHDDIKRGIIPEIFLQQEVDGPEPEEVEEVKVSTTLKMPTNCNVELL